MDGLRVGAHHDVPEPGTCTGTARTHAPVLTVSTVMTPASTSLRDRLRTFSEPVWAEWPEAEDYPVTAEDEAELIALAIDPELLDADPDDLDCWLPVRAWRALGVLGSVAAVEPLLDLLERHDDDWLTQDFPEMCARIGLRAIPVLRAFGVDANRDTVARMNAAEALERIGEVHPHARDGCVEALSAMLADFQRHEPGLNAMIIGCLTGLHATEAAPLMQAVFEAGKADLRLGGDWEDVQIELGLLDQRSSPELPVPDDEERAGGPPLPGWRSLDPEGVAALRAVFEGPDAEGPVRSLRMLEGFLYTVACVPAVVQSSEWIEFLRVDRGAGRSESDARALLGALFLLYNGIQTTVNEKEFAPPDGLFRDDPLSNLDPEAEASQWAQGFVLGYAWLEDAWHDGSRDEEEERPGLALASMALSFFASRKVAASFASGVAESEERAAEVAAKVRAFWPSALVEYATLGRELLRRRMAGLRSRTVRVDPEERVGRNDPCPCGSGRKYKKCCGRGAG